MKMAALTKSQLTTKIVECIFPNQPIKQSLERTSIEMCGYTKIELLNILIFVSQNN
jgi:hypothetical protein